ncbi:MAG: 4-alpha-glucanotransferase [Chthoniobacteraceae bacterium]
MHLAPDQKIAGLLAPLFALRSETDLGIGDLGALRDFIDWAADFGFRVVQLLPVNETGNDNSPYNAISSVALDITTIEVSPEAVYDLGRPEYEKALGALNLEALRTGPVNYPVVKSLKRDLLREAFSRFAKKELGRQTPRAHAFQKWVGAQKDWIEGYALFRVLMDENSGTERWDFWPEEQQNAAAARKWLATLPQAKRHQLEHEMTFCKYIQWIAWEQWHAIREYAESRHIALMGDVPFGVSYYSADVFSEPEIFDHKWSGGAPPEPLFKDDPFTVKWGQNWGVPLYRWDVLRTRNLDWWRQRVRKVREIFHLFRIDHVLGFYRIYAFPWRPQMNADYLSMTPAEARARTGGDLPRFHEFDDESPEHCARNRQHGEALLRALQEETGPYRLIGEDLGTVPKYVRPSLTSLGIAGFKIPMWEQEWNTHLIPGDQYQRLSLATYATHDHEPLRALWEKWMAIIAAGESGREEDAEARNAAWWEVRRLAGWAGFEVPRILPFDDEVHEQFLGGLFRCNSWIAITMITDLFATTQRFNVPGAVSESNWSQRLLTTVRDWAKNPAIMEKMNRIRDLLRANGRIPV